MKKLILKMSMSANGFVGGPNGEIDWLFTSPDTAATAWTVATLWDASLHLMGSRTYHDMAAYWPTSTESYAPPMNDIPKAIFTRKGLLPPTESSTTTALRNARAANPGRVAGTATRAIMASWQKPLVVRGDLAEEIKKLKESDGKPLLAHGGAEFSRSLIKSGLIDEYRLLVYPVMLGRGLAIFSELARPLALTLIESARFPTGIVTLIYRPKMPG